MDSGSNLPPLSPLDNGLGVPDGNLEDALQSELDMILQEQYGRAVSNQERDLNILRSGSAPPTVDGSLRAVGSLSRGHPGQIVDRGGNRNGGLSDEDIRSHPAYSSYYYSNEHLNPRLPLPLLSKEDWRVTQRYQAGGSGLGLPGDRSRRTIDGGDNASLFSMQPGSLVDKAENDLMELRNAGRRNLPRQTSTVWVDRSQNGLTGYTGTGLGHRRKSFADIVQGGLDAPPSHSDHPSRPASCNSFGNTVDRSTIPNSNLEGLGNVVESLQGSSSGASSSGGVRVYQCDTNLHSVPSVVGSSLSRSTTPELHRSSISGLPPMSSRPFPTEKHRTDMNYHNGHSSGLTGLADIAASLSELSLSGVRNTDGDDLAYDLVNKMDGHPDPLINRPRGQDQNLQQLLFDNSNLGKSSVPEDYVNLGGRNESLKNLGPSGMSYNEAVSIPKRTHSAASLYSKATFSGSESLEGLNVIQKATNQDLDLGASGDGDRWEKMRSQVRSTLQSGVVDQSYVQYLQRISDSVVSGPSSTSQYGNLYQASSGDLSALQRAYLETMLAQQKQQYELATLGRFGGLGHGNSGCRNYGLGLPYTQKSVAANSALPNVGFGRQMLQDDFHARSMTRSSVGGSIGSLAMGIGANGDGRVASSLLDELKSNKAQSFELLDIVNHVVEFSMDQYGSRFIQQKLETATVEEKTKIFPEIIPHALTLMTDVFGNYVIQKFFEHGIESQRKELAAQLKGHVLLLSLHMYGCRVIQKALEMVDVDQRTELVAELDGSIIKCVHDQNGNHVVQKCIECVPQDRIQFIISTFYGQVVELSTHPYGCRVIQRVLEHCDNPTTQQIIMDEIMQSVSLLAQDQYGNYVIQHVVEHGKPHERSAIINKLTGQIVKMSQQKFASNVVEKCLAFGTPDERQLLVNEMLVSDDGSDPLQALMKDPFGNYVVQKVLETCDKQNLELILSRIKDHLNTLKKYTYGKHIVSRVEKLILAGERRIGLSSSLSS